VLGRSRLRIPEPGELSRGQAVVAWRFWGVGESDDGEYRLQSPFRATVWEPGTPFAATCLSPQLTLGPLRHRHQAPDPGCRCGVYGGTYRELRTFLYSNLVRPSSTPVLGRVSIWGVVLEDESSSWRGSFGYPERLLVPTLLRNAFRVARDLEAYGVPVTMLDLQDMFSALHPAGRPGLTVR
jgi:hypothetical protein